MQQEKSLERALAGTGAAVDFSGTWLNELGSTVVLTQKSDVLAGTYTSAVSGSGGKTQGNLQGYVDGGLISFVVHWKDFQAITAWVGELDPKAPKQTINTLWHMTKKVPTGDEWAAINAGADYFTRQ